MRTLAQGVLLAFGIAFLCTVVMGGRFLAREYGHGDRLMVTHLIDHVL